MKYYQFKNECGKWNREHEGIARIIKHQSKTFKELAEQEPETIYDDLLIAFEKRFRNTQEKFKRTKFVIEIDANYELYKLTDKKDTIE